jgi:hypothetical protein
MSEKKNAMEMSPAEFDQAVRAIGWREHFARERAIEDAYLARFLDLNPDLKPKPAEPSEAVTKTHVDITLREKQDHTALGEYLRRNFPNHGDWYARRHGLPVENTSSATTDDKITDEQREVADAAEVFLKSKGA